MVAPFACLTHLWDESYKYHTDKFLLCNKCNRDTNVLHCHSNKYRRAPAFREREFTSIATDRDLHRPGAGKLVAKGCVELDCLKRAVSIELGPSKHVARNGFSRSRKKPRGSELRKFASTVAT